MKNIFPECRNYTSILAKEAHLELNEPSLELTDTGVSWHFVSHARTHIHTHTVSIPHNKNLACVCARRYVNESAVQKKAITNGERETSGLFPKKKQKTMLLELTC